MIDPQALLAHARKLAGSGQGRPPDVDLRRGVSAAYYALFHEVTRLAARHLIGAASDEHQSSIRRAWSHGELAAAAAMVVDRSKALAGNPNAPLTKPQASYGRLIDLAATDGDLVAALTDFSALQELRHRADYDHDALFDKAGLLAACQQADQAIAALSASDAAARQAFFTTLTVQRTDFRERR